MNKYVIGQQMYTFCNEIFPICRSITGDGVRETLKYFEKGISEEGVKLDVHEVPSGTHVFDWTVPKEWRIQEAYIEDESGHRVIDFRQNNLHVLGYSVPVDACPRTRRIP